MIIMFLILLMKIEAFFLFVCGSCVHMPTKARSGHQMSSCVAHHPSSLRQGFSVNLELTDWLDRLAGEL